MASCMSVGFLRWKGFSFSHLQSKSFNIFWSSTTQSCTEGIFLFLPRSWKVFLLKSAAPPRVNNVSFLSGEFTGGSERTFSVMIAASSEGFCALQRARCLRSNLLCIPDLSLPLLQVSEENGLRAERKVLKEMQPKSPATVKPTFV